MLVKWIITADSQRRYIKKNISSKILYAVVEEYKRDFFLIGTKVLAPEICSSPAVCSWL